MTVPNSLVVICPARVVSVNESAVLRGMRLSRAFWKRMTSLQSLCHGRGGTTSAESGEQERNGGRGAAYHHRPCPDVAC